MHPTSNPLFLMSPRSEHVSEETIEIELPSDIKKLDESLFYLHRKIEGLYQFLPWPAQMQKIVVMTEVKGGKGDIAAAAKIIDYMQQNCSDLTFDWVLQSDDLLFAKSLLSSFDPSKICIRKYGSTPPEEIEADLLIVGPVKFAHNLSECELKINREIAGPIFGFMEIAKELHSFHHTTPRSLIHKANPSENIKEIYQNLHLNIFPGESSSNQGLVPMGLQPGTGIFLNKNRMEASLSRAYCCPSYIPLIENTKLRQDILSAMHCDDAKSLPDYDRYSFNFGYAHYSTSWGNYIDCVAIHEKDKDVIIVLNQCGEFDRLSTLNFSETIFTPERLVLLKEKGYGQVTLKGEEEIILVSPIDCQIKRNLTVIVRASFTPNDMKQMQLASERLLATGDNSAIEAWSALCKLYLYEDVANGGCKWRFLQQQVDLATTISPNLSKLLALFGGDRRLRNDSINEPFNKEQMDEIECCLNDPQLSDATLAFCHQITDNYSFEKVLEGAIKRTVWQSYIPELMDLEAETMDEEFKSGLISYIRNQGISTKTLFVRRLPELEKKINSMVQSQFMCDHTQ